MLIAAFTLLLIAAFWYIVGLYFLWTASPAGMPQFTPFEIANFTGICSMLFLPVFIVTAVTVNIREKAKNDRNPKPGATERR